MRKQAFEARFVEQLDALSIDWGPFHSMCDGHETIGAFFVEFDPLLE